MVKNGLVKLPPDIFFSSQVKDTLKTQYLTHIKTVLQLKNTHKKTHNSLKIRRLYDIINYISG
jgi:hypothetical protein